MNNPDRQPLSIHVAFRLVVQYNVLVKFEMSLPDAVQDFYLMMCFFIFARWPCYNTIENFLKEVAHCNRTCHYSRRIFLQVELRFESGDLLIHDVDDS